MHLQAGDVEVTVDPEQGGRVASLRVGGHELLVAEADVDDLMLWGCYPMVPWAGRVRDGRFTFDGEAHQLPLDAPPHAIHGVGYRSPWTVTGPGALLLELDWPFGGMAQQTFALTANALALTMTIAAGDRPMPIVAGWHPCFRRHLDRGGEVAVAFDATCMWERDASGIPNGELVSVPVGPWDDCFGGLSGPPRLEWPGAVALTLRSECPVWVVYDQDPRLVCVEPQSDAPDAFNREPGVVAPGDELQIRLTMEWST